MSLHHWQRLLGAVPLAWRRHGQGTTARRPSRLRLGLSAGLPLLWALLPWREDLASRLPAWSADRPVIAFCQTSVLLLGLGGTLVPLRRHLLTPR